MKKQNKEQAIESTTLPKANHYNACFSFAKRSIKKRKGTFTSEHIIEAYLSKKSRPIPEEPRVWGKVFQDLHRAGEIRATGRYVPYKKECGHGKPTRVWIRNQIITFTKKTTLCNFTKGKSTWNEICMY